ncbi:similar to Saccharomyces cerevisiae YMR052W FAR3 Protein involved in recovery from cell cycle arrest in response to pheromone, in a Far1p-independent pathway [Maudiozyma barnettii]|uniref:Similar to Saccharomyces cerevisiae YMR052W FAR3 Protein involved in recovery from cell cycle arrest in response to pheromone, in a Far1p-independent pathway n=1 Tax=Maudiozyma barnettii TaxID=61262 RepID=A0A8H2ZI15_9SACH|nr:Far3p [Kazachstania barnettii]CAB4256374.1 similar to Saccharomyces cerevisiae YMR052W FAR3 Protein involved in recovery from cell cycle arrest in response to pheromone, in a Far1p-independent pathway [Kazachstania barnettii]CAD1784983.1 similar to Saccharomyces cerevisiae YMR052W FAR3 Protein involved in recovery from cell cycle arrest in response to pheromone, in a Far1p-independent pathway [Kazachstania barnettii]
MNETANDNFQYISQLMGVLASESRSNRQETDKIELLLKRVAKQSSISYEKLGEEVTSETLDNYEKLSIPTKMDTLINENYDLLYQIEQQRFVNNKISILIQSIMEHFVSIKNFIKEQKFMREQDLDNFIYENFESQAVILNSHIDILREKKDISGKNLSRIIAQLESMFKNIDWSLISKDKHEFKLLLSQIQNLDESFNIKLLSKEDITVAKTYCK